MARARSWRLADEPEAIEDADIPLMSVATFVEISIVIETRHSAEGAPCELRRLLSYALAISTGEPLLFKGNNFGHTASIVACRIEVNAQRLRRPKSHDESP